MAKAKKKAAPKKKPVTKVDNSCPYDRSVNCYPECLFFKAGTLPTKEIGLFCRGYMFKKMKAGI